MTCSEVMTSNPSCCVASDSVAMAAQIMKREDVGPVLVVSDYNSRTLVGIVTDRDLALKVVAEGRDPHNTRLDEVMTANPVTCGPEDSTSDALRLMGDHQVRRIPIVDSSNRLIGIVAQADLARHEDEEDVGQMVEEISQPYGSAPTWFSSSGEPQFEDEYEERMSDSQSIARPLAIGAVCLGAGAALMYLMDPTRGAVRRTRTREKAASLSSASVDALARKAADLRNRATGAVASGKSWLRDEPVDDERLVARVRSKLGHITQSYSIEVEANNGHVTLSGSVPGNELSRLVKGAKSIPGVRSIENRLSTFSPSGSDSSVNAGDGWSPRTRVMASAVGGGLLLWGLKSKGRVGKASATLGFGLLTRGLMNREMPGTTGLGDLRKLAGL